MKNLQWNRPEKLLGLLEAATDVYLYGHIFMKTFVLVGGAPFSSNTGMS